MSKIEWSERKKAKFIREYKNLCLKHEMMIGMRDAVEIGTYSVYMVVDFRGDPIQLDKAIEEMLIEDIFKLDEP